MVAAGYAYSPRMFWQEGRMSVGMEARALLIPALVYHERLNNKYIQQPISQ
jgi:hypothetical protein